MLFSLTLGILAISKPFLIHVEVDMMVNTQSRRENTAQQNTSYHLAGIQLEPLARGVG